MSRPTRVQTWIAEGRELARLAGPLIAAQLALISMNAVDTVMAGHLGARDLAAVALGGSLWVPSYIAAAGVLMAVSPSVAHLFGAGRFHDVGHQVRQGLWLAVFATVPVVLFLLNAAPILTWIGAPEDVQPLAAGYLRAMACGAPAALAYTALRSYCEGVSDTLSIMLISLVGVACNIAGNRVFMYGMYGLPALGAVGTGVASALVMWTMFGCLTGWILWSPRHRRFQCFRLELPAVGELLALFRLGLPIGISLFLECSLFSIVSLWMGSLGTVVISGHQVALNFASITFMVPLGIAMAITVRVGQAMGREDPAAARVSGGVGIAMCLGVMTLAALTMLTFPQEIAAVYTIDSRVREMAVVLLGMAAIFQISDGLQVSGAGALRGLKDTTAPMLITLTAYWGVGLPLALFLGFGAGLGPRGLWIGLIASLTAAALLLNLRFFWKTGRLIQRDSELAVEAKLADEVVA